MQTIDENASTSVSVRETLTPGQVDSRNQDIVAYNKALARRTRKHGDANATRETIAMMNAVSQRLGGTR